jgi:hypothetical protein
MTIEIKPGGELDAAVAEACGIEGCIKQMELPNGDLSRGFFYISYGSMANDQFWSPSTDFNAAFRAAAKVGLFRMFHRFLSDDEVSGYAVYESNDDGFSVLASGETPALAICAAILKLSENR